MTNPIDRRLDRLETQVQNKIGEPNRWQPGRDPVFQLIDDPRDPENPKRLEEARQFRRDHPNGLIIRNVIISPPRGKPNWEGVSSKERERWLAAYDRYDGLNNTFQEPAPTQTENG